MALIIIISVIILKALVDGLFFRSKKRFSKWVEEAWFNVLVIYLYQHNRQSEFEFVHFLICTYAMRAAIFDTFRNIFSNAPIFFKGTTSEWDDFMSKLKTWQYILTKLFFLTISLIIYFIWLK